MNIGPLIERVESPQITGEGKNRTISRIYNVGNNEDWQSYLPEKLALSPDGDGYFLNFSTRRGAGYTIVTLNYSSRRDNGGGGTSGPPRRDNEVRFDLTINNIEKPLEAHEDYLASWNYDLYGYAADGVTAPSLPSWSLTADDRSDADGVEFYWSKDRPAPPSTGAWFKIQDRTKEGVEAYPVPQPVITERKFCKQEQAAIAYLPKAITRKAPGDTKGFASAATNWLQMPRGIDYDGEFYVAVIEYLYSDLDKNGVGWDADIYA